MCQVITSPPVKTSTPKVKEKMEVQSPSYRRASTRGQVVPAPPI